MHTPASIKQAIYSSIPQLSRKNFIDDLVQDILLKLLLGSDLTVRELALEYLSQNPEDFYPFFKHHEPLSVDTHDTINLVLDVERALSGQDKLIAYLLLLGFTELEISEELGVSEEEVTIKRDNRFTRN